MKNILMLLENEFPHDDRVEKEALSLLDNGFDVFLLCPTFSDQVRLEEYHGIIINRFSIKKSLFNKLLGLIQLTPFYKILWRSRVDVLVKKYHIDAVHIHDLPLCCLIRSLKRSGDLKIIADMHENYPAMVAGQEHMRQIPNKYLISISKWYGLEKKWLREADLIICTANGMITRLKEVLGKKMEFALAPNTIDLTMFEASQKESVDIAERYDEDFLILSYGVVSEQRGIQYVIKAIGLIGDKIPNLKLVVLGDGSFMDALKALAVDVRVQNKIIFEGWQKQSLLNAYMVNTDICIIPHIKSEHTDNTSPNKLFHFMYFGKPVLTSNCNYIQEIVNEEACGLVYEYDNVKALAESIMKLYENDDLREKMGKNGKSAVLSKYNWEKTVVSMIQKYKSMIEI